MINKTFTLISYLMVIVALTLITSCENEKTATKKVEPANKQNPQPIAEPTTQANNTSVQSATANTITPSTNNALTIKQVETKYVCMVNNKLFQKVQIPVEYNGKTYYGCCEGCVKTLQTDASARQAKDPITGKMVDKVDAIKGALPNGKVLYFASTETFQKFKKVH